MSRVDTRNNTNIIQSNQAGGVDKGSKLNEAASKQAVRQFTNIREKFKGNQSITSKKTKRVVAASDIEETDLQPLAGKNRDQMMAELSQILVSILAHDEMTGEDDTSKLCKMMLNEHVRRLSMITGTEVVSDGLKGSA